MTRTGITVFILLLGVFLGGGYILGVLFPFIQQNTPLVSYERQISTSTIQVLVEDLSDETDYATVHAEVPQFPVLPQEFNAKIQSLARDMIVEHKKSSQENWTARAETSSGTIPALPSKDEKFPFFVSWEAKQVNPRFVSMLLRYGGFNGGAHGYEAIATFNYDLVQKKEVGLADLFSGNPEYLSVISSTSVAALEQSIPESMGAPLDERLRTTIEDGAGARLENYNRFTFTDDVITIYFAQYQVGPYVIGMPTVMIPRKS